MHNVMQSCQAYSILKVIAADGDRGVKPPNPIQFSITGSKEYFALLYDDDVTFLLQFLSLTNFARNNFQNRILF